MLSFIMRRDSNFGRRINNALNKTAVNTDLSLTKLLLHHIDNRMISAQSLEYLKENEGRAQKTYNKIILPKIEGLFREMSRYGAGFPCGPKGPAVFSTRKPEEIRRKIKNSYNNQFKLSGTTTEALNSMENMPYDYTKGSMYCFNRNSEHIVSLRRKLKQEETRKIVTNYNKLDADERVGVWNFIAGYAEMGARTSESHNYLLKKYGKKITDIMIDDSFGIKILNMNQKKFKDNADFLTGRGLEDFKDFHTIRVKDHRGRNDNLRPGGLHYILTDKYFPGFPIEVQFRGIKDEVYNLLEKHASWKYGKDKKSCEFYDD